MISEPDPDWYLDHVLYYAEPGSNATLVVGAAVQWQAWWRSRAVSLGDELRCVALTAELAAAGIPRHVVRRRVREGQWSAPQRGTVALVDPTAPDASGRRASAVVIARRRHALAAACAALANPGCVGSGRSAAVLHGLPTLDVPTSPTLSAAPERGSHRARVARVDPDEVTHWFGIPVTDVARTVVDLARHDRRDGLMAADAALHEGLTRPLDLDRALARASRWPGVEQAREILGLADALAESPLESVLRLAIHDAGLPAPKLQREISVPGRHWPYRVDLLWPEQRLIVEADGRAKYSDDQLWAEKKRETALRRCRYRVERVIWSDVLDSWPATLDMLREALAG